MGRAARVDVSAEDELRPRVRPQPALEVGAVHEVAGVRQAGRGHPGCLGQDGKVRGDDDEVGLASTSPSRPTYCGGAGPRSTSTPVTARRQLERLLVEQPNPMLAGALRELVAEAEVVVAVHRRERSDVRRRQPGEHVREIARVRELNAVAEEEDQIDPRLGEPRERRVDALVELLGLEDVDPARAGRLELAVEIAEDADAH